MNKKDFIKEVGRRYINGKDVYYDIVNTIVSSLYRDGEIDLPGIGKLVIKTMQPHKIRDVNSGEVKYTGKTKSIKYVPAKIMKDMFK